MEVPRSRAVAAEVHVVDTLRRQVDAIAFAGIGCGQIQCVTGVERVQVRRTRVVDLRGVFQVEGEATVEHVAANAPRRHVLGQLQKVILVGLETADHAGTYLGLHTVGQQASGQSAQVDIHIGTAHDALTQIKERPLASDKARDLQSLGGLKACTDAIDRIVEAEVSLLVRAQDHARAELLVEVAHGDVCVLILVAREAVRHAYAGTVAA